ncbi:Cytochrome P450 monooxygenase orf5 [Cladobotryum mycophilum]|uniref:Cytochrome P450 monooxygenase orf5 n=1 Tax=Cladobotryum mycophilum TaxID=491253 RepID=A0ABR0SW10_9HYPO
MEQLLTQIFAGPNEVAVFGLDAYNQVHGSESRCGRAAYYDIVQPMVSLDTTLDENDYTYRSLEKAESIIYSRVTELAKQLHMRESKRLNNNPKERRNIIGYVLSDAERNGGVKANWNFVLGDFVLVIIAGSDPIRQVLTNMMYYLILHRKYMTHIRNELVDIDINDYKTLQPVPSAGLRLPPPGGIVINGIYIPENTTLVTPQYSLMREDKRYFQDPEEWVPERFTTRPELILNKNAFYPRYGTRGGRMIGDSDAKKLAPTFGLPLGHLLVRALRAAERIGDMKRTNSHWREKPEHKDAFLHWSPKM